MGHLHTRQILKKIAIVKFITTVTFLKLVKLQSLVAKCEQYDTVKFAMFVF